MSVTEIESFRQYESVNEGTILRTMFVLHDASSGLSDESLEQGDEVPGHSGYYVKRSWIRPDPGTGPYGRQRRVVVVVALKRRLY